MRSVTQVYEGGFSDAVFNSQEVFRALMDAMASPGRVIEIGNLAAAPSPISSVAASVAATLFDHDATVWCDKSITSSAAAIGWLKFHTGLELTSNPSDAQFALIGDLETMPSLESFAKGTSEYPDRSTTIILQVNGFNGPEELTLSGPGIENRQAFAPSKLPKMFVDQWTANRGAFPRGVDLIFAGKGALAALPRATRISKMEA
ncbi:phosphonate C-P lyase system protein PhnH [Phyllobacterium zundukense]|jgi:alpha-D-ribose 1-methylphosphonate 5-triphosphate synthase subunit PhnH|uniref:Phosphonate C-P lyase system protein PhnH n=1 Tax=Phyllobacterium zundukense TaxID=1867719 RepID=A0ACD4D1L7_9HYPH|nr:phosphonate C-P lyase system protein PhnH [Phyllobacterium zundukense]UXN59783.1 phosphonate C-P lyase system protein PhnH [Phyllobacterium zundukense]